VLTEARWMREVREQTLDAGRVAGFSDGVFAVAITLLILNIQVPDTTISLRDLIVRQGISYLVFIVSFMMIGIKWMNHHRMFSAIRRVDTTLNLLNLLLLLGICTVPFTAALIAKYATTPDAAYASLIYGAIWALNGCLYTAILVYARRAGLAAPVEHSRRMLILYAVGPLAYLGAATVSFWNIYAGIVLYVIIVSLYIFPQ
jgi:uncharacterized membrane protein